MKLINNYIEEYGDIPFSSKEINNIDYAIFSVLSYVDFEDIIKDIKIPLGEALTKFIFFADRKEFVKKGFVQKELFEFVTRIVDKKRYKDLLVSDYVYKLTDNEQFGALTIHLSKREKIISFEGTDDKLVSWEEDFAFANTSLAPADKDAINYLNRIIKIFDKKIIVVGHSKGGRLSVTSSMYVSKFKQDKIKEIYSFDGPGLLASELTKNEYLRIKHKIKHFIPNYSLVGMVFNHNVEDIVVKATYVDIRAHSVFSWIVAGNDFQKSELSDISKKWHKSVDEWLKIYTPDERKAIFRQVFNTFRDLGYVRLTEIFHVKNILNIILKTRKYDDDTKRILKNFFAFTIKNLVK